MGQVPFWYATLNFNDLLCRFFTKGIFILSIQKWSHFQLITLFSNCNADKEAPICFILLIEKKTRFFFGVLSKSFCIFFPPKQRSCPQFKYQRQLQLNSYVFLLKQGKKFQPLLKSDPKSNSSFFFSICYCRIFQLKQGEILALYLLFVLL